MLGVFECPVIIEGVVVATLGEIALHDPMDGVASEEPLPFDVFLLDDRRTRK